MPLPILKLRKLHVDVDEVGNARIWVILEDENGNIVQPQGAQVDLLCMRLAEIFRLSGYPQRGGSRMIH
jgi:hypothetical protein